MAYPTRESNNREGGSPNESERQAVEDYMESTKDYDDDADDYAEAQSDAKDTDGQYDQTSVGPYVDRKHPHQDAQDRDPGDHPHAGLNKHADKEMDKGQFHKHVGGY